jgi:DNA-binding response OmpR family regulator
MNALSPVLRSGEIYREEITRLRGKVEFLEEQNRQLKELVQPGFIFPVEWRLSVSESRVLALLSVAPDGFRTREALRNAACGVDSETGAKVVDVYVFKIRRKIGPHGILIETVWGRGYRLSSENRAKVIAARKSTVAA